jgi:phosphate transport system protein
MFREILKFWTSKDLMKRALAQTEEMFRITNQLFDDVSQYFLNNQPVSYDIYKRDQEINRYEIQIRREVLEHLTINPREDVLAALIMTAVIIHLERIGDYSKNIYELRELHGRPFHFSKTHEKSTQFYARVHSMFDNTRRAFFNGEPQQGRQVMDDHEQLKKDCDAHIKKITESEEFNSRDAVVSVLTSRYFKRVSAHLFNIASSVVNPYDLIGFARDRNK